MTKRLYYTDSYTIKFAAQLREKMDYEGKPAVVLDSTYFYPTSGGQPYDTGTLNNVPVMDVFTRPDDQSVLHIVDQYPDSDQVQGQINWQRRFDHMRQHTGQHILSRAFIEVINAETLSFHLSENSVTIDLNAADVPLADLDVVENLANQIIAENRAVRAWFPEPDELAALPLRKVSEKITGAVRVVDIGGFDICACGGTHVAYTGEIGIIKVVKLERSKKNIRVEFCCGQRGVEDYRQKNNILLNLASDLTVGYWEIPGAFERLRNENKTLQRDLKTARARLLEYEAESLWQAARDANPNAKWVIVTAVWEDREVADLQGAVAALVQKPNTIAILALPGEKAHLIMGCSEATGFDVVPLLKESLAKLGQNRGGGRPTLAQGGGFSAAREQLEAILAEAKITLDR